MCRFYKFVLNFNKRGVVKTPQTPRPCGHAYRKYVEYCKIFKTVDDNHCQSLQKLNLIYLFFCYRHLVKHRSNNISDTAYIFYADIEINICIVNTIVLSQGPIFVIVRHWRHTIIIYIYYFFIWFVGFEKNLKRALHGNKIST